MAIKEREKAIIASKAQSIINEHGPFLESLVAEIKREIESPINAVTVDSIALEYKYRQGIKEGLTLFMKKLNAKSYE